MIKGNKILYNAAMIFLGRRRILNGLTRNIHGTGNTFKADSTAVFGNCKVDIIGDNNQIDIRDLCIFRNVTFLIRGNNNRIVISSGTRFGYGGSLHIEDHDCLLYIGANSTFEDAHIAVTEPGSEIVIGDDCMFAYDIDLRTGDSHSIIDVTTNKRLNPPGNITIGDHVWIAPHCSILKGVEIKRNCIVATRSVITRSFDQEGVIIGGSPSRVLRENISWSRTRMQC